MGYGLAGLLSFVKILHHTPIAYMIYLKRRGSGDNIERRRKLKSICYKRSSVGDGYITYIYFSL